MSDVEGAILRSDRVQLFNDRTTLWGFRFLTIRGTLHFVQVPGGPGVVFEEDYDISTWAFRLEDVCYLGDPPVDLLDRLSSSIPRAMRVDFGGKHQIVLFLGEPAESAHLQEQLALANIAGTGKAKSLLRSAQYLWRWKEYTANAAAAKQAWLQILPQA